MPSTKTSAAVPQHLKGNANGLLSRLDKYHGELNLRRGGTPYHPAMFTDASESPSEIAIDCVALARAYIEAMEHDISESVYRR